MGLLKREYLHALKNIQGWYQKQCLMNETAAIGIMCKTLGVDLKVVDVGMKNSIPRSYENLYNMKVMNGTENLYKTPAMTVEQAVEAIENGILMMEELESEL